MQAVTDALCTLVQGQVDLKAMAQKRAEKQQYSQETKSRCSKLEQQLENARRTRLRAYKDKATGILSEEEFNYISQSLRNEEICCKQELSRLTILENDQGRTCIIEKKIKTFLRFDHLEKSQLRQLVRRVEVDVNKHIIIIFNFTDPRQGNGGAALPMGRG